MSEDALFTARFIMANEVSGGDMRRIVQGYYANAAHPHLPPNSGVTIGFGYDLGQHTAEEIERDWGGVLPTGVVARLKQFAKTPHEKNGRFDRAAFQALERDVTIRYEDAVKVFHDRVLPKYVERAMERFPGLDRLDPVEQSVIIDRVYWRGSKPDPKKDKTAYRKYNELAKAVFQRDSKAIVGIVKSMKVLHKQPGTIARAVRSGNVLEKHLREQHRPAVNGGGPKTKMIEGSVGYAPPGFKV